MPDPSSLEASAGLPAWAVVGRKRLEHIRRVADLAARWAAAMDVPSEERDRWLRAVWLHDALRDAPEPELRRLAGDATASADLLHGPAAAVRAAEEGERDQGVLLAVRFHSIGSPDWDRAGRALYCADFLEPGRKFDREERAALAEAYPRDPEGVLVEIARRRINNTVRRGWQILEPTWRFWNSLTSPRP